jgi:2'-5' RNA ligase
MTGRARPRSTGSGQGRGRQRATDPDAIRAFLALELPESHREQIAAEQRRLRVGLPPARWVRPEGIHLTIKFLGETPQGVLDELVQALRAPVAACPAVSVTLEGSGFFPGPARPRVAWIGGQARGIEALVDAVEQQAGRLGLERERRQWSLHLTLARLREPWPPDAVDRFLSWGECLALPVFECTELVLLASRLGPGGAVYTALARLPIGLEGGGRA